MQKLLPLPSRPSIRFHGLTPQTPLRRTAPLIGVVRTVDRFTPDETIIGLLDVAVGNPGARTACGISEATFITSSEEGTTESPALHKIEVKLGGAFKNLPIKVDDILTVFGGDVKIVNKDEPVMRGDHPLVVIVTAFSFGSVVCQVLPVVLRGGQPQYELQTGWVEYTANGTGLNLVSKPLHTNTSRREDSPKKKTASKEDSVDDDTNNNKKPRLADTGYATLNILSQGKTDVYGIVVRFTSPKRTVTMDYKVEYHIIDETVTVPITVTMFDARMDSFPDVKILGDIIRLHRAEVSQFNNRPALSIGKRGTTVVVTSGTPGDMAERFTKADKTESRSGLDFHRVEQLRKYAIDHVWRVGAAATTLPPADTLPWIGPYYKSLGDIANDLTNAKETYVDTLVKIVEMKRIYGDFPRIITVCDGSLGSNDNNAMELHFDLVFWLQQDWDQVQNYYLGDSMIGTWVRIRNFVASRSEESFELKFNELKSACGFMRVPAFCGHPDDMRNKRLARGGVSTAGSSPRKTPVETSSSSSSSSLLTIPLTSLVLAKPGELPKRIIISSLLPKYAHLTPVSVAQIINGQTNSQAPWRCVLRYLHHKPQTIESCIVSNPNTKHAECRFLMDMCDSTGYISGLFLGTAASRFFRFEEFAGVLDEDAAAHLRLASAFTLMKHLDCYVDVVLFPVTMSEALFEIRGAQLRVTGLDPVVAMKENEM